MNIFYLHNDPVECAKLHNDKHVVKMILEYGQLMSTAHRVLDGTEYYARTANNRRIKRWLLEDYERENILWKASHISHPSGIWTRKTDSNYRWLHSLWENLLEEYTFRYGKFHSAERMRKVFQRLPDNIPAGPFTEPTPAMPDKYKVPSDSIQSYKNYYIGDKQHLASWKKRFVPNWYVTA
jgi:hypothetical protein